MFVERMQQFPLSHTFVDFVGFLKLFFAKRF
jgi:hypothetical protein